MTVQWVRFGDVLQMRRVAVDVDLDQMYRPVGLRAFGRGIFDYPISAGADLSKVRYFDLPADALVISNIKGWEGAVAVTTPEEQGRIASSRFLTYQPTKGVDPSYARHWLLSDAGMDVLDRCSPGSADRNRTLSRASLEASLLPLPPPAEQRRIAAHLDQLSGTWQRSSASPGTADSVLHALVRRAAANAPRRRLRDLLHLDREWIDVSDARLYRAIGVRGFGRGLIRYPGVAGDQLSKLRYFKVKPDRLVVSNIKAWEGAVTQTHASDEGLVGSNRFLQYEVTSGEVSLAWVLAYLASPEGIEALSAASPGSADRNRTLSIRSFEGIEIPVPVDAIQDLVEVAASGVQRVLTLDRRRQDLVHALVPAARNEIFNAMR